MNRNVGDWTSLDLLEVHPEKPTSVAGQRHMVVDELFEKRLLTRVYIFASLCTW